MYEILHNKKEGHMAELMEQVSVNDEITIDIEEALASIPMNTGSRCGHPVDRGARLRFAAIKPNRASSRRITMGASRQELRLNATLTVEPRIGKVLVPSTILVVEDGIDVPPFPDEQDDIDITIPMVVDPPPAPKPVRKPAPKSSSTSRFSSSEIRAYGPGGFSPRTTFAAYIPKRG